MFVLKNNSKTVGMIHKERSYVVGFKKALVCRNVLHSLHPDPKFTLIRGELLYEKGIFFDTDSTLFIPKFQGKISNPLNDGGYHLDSMTDEYFYNMPFLKGVGIICPYLLLDEDSNEFIFKSHVVDILI